MDAIPGPAVAVRFAPDPRLTAAAAIAAVVAAALAWSAPAPGRLLFGLAAGVLACYVLGDVLFRPRLAADRHGLRVRSPLARATLNWPEVDAVRADVRTRHGWRSVTLEIDTGSSLIVLSRRALGADPVLVARTVTALNPRR